MPHQVYIQNRDAGVFQRTIKSLLEKGYLVKHIQAVPQVSQCVYRGGDTLVRTEHTNLFIALLEREAPVEGEITDALPTQDSTESLHT